MSPMHSFDAHVLKDSEGDEQVGRLPTASSEEQRLLLSVFLVCSVSVVQNTTATSHDHQF